MTRNKKAKILKLLLCLPLGAFGASTEIPTSTTALKIDLEKNDLSTYFKSQYLSQDSKQNSANRFQVQMGFELEKRISTDFKFLLNTGVNLETGNSDSLNDNNEFSASNDISLKRAEFVWNPLNEIELRAGALAMKDTNHRMLLGYGTFLGLKESYRFKKDKLDVKLSAVQAIPKNANYSNRLDKVDEENPSFFLETLEIKYGGKKEYIKSSSSQFSFADMSNSVAGASNYLGNSVNLSDKDNGEFIFSYIGLAQRLEANFASNALELNPYVEYVVNTAAPSKNEARLLGLKTTYSKNDKEYSVDGSLFDTDADASVAYYNTSRYRHNNKRGTVIELGYNDLKENYDLNLTIIQSKIKNVIQVDDEDKEEQLIAITLRKEYDIF